jgi:hypothetical protein
MDDYKLAKEAFHANNQGSSIWNINAVTAAALVSSSEHQKMLIHVVFLCPLCMRYSRQKVKSHTRLYDNGTTSIAGRYRFLGTSVHV